MPVLARKGIPKAKSMPSKKPLLRDYEGSSQKPAELNDQSEKYRAVTTQQGGYIKIVQSLHSEWGGRVGF